MRLSRTQYDGFSNRRNWRFAVPLCFTALVWLAGMLSGCARFRSHPHEYVYVAAREVYLRDRVAAVSNRVALVKNGQRLEVVEHGHRFDQVRTPDGKLGWLQDHTVIDQQEFDQYQQLGRDHAQDPVVATAQLRDDLYLHLTPGRQTDHFYLVPGNSHVQLLERASIPHVVPGAVPASAGQKAGQPADQPPVVPMEDWWLVRDSSGNTGWLLGSRVDVDIPDAIGEYAEGQRMVAAYPLATVTDNGDAARDRARGHRGLDRRGYAHAPGGESQGGGQAPSVAGDSADAAEQQLSGPKQRIEYLVLLAAPRSGLPYDFDQIRVFTWSLNHHRYETAYRLRDFEGFFPVTMSHESVNGVSYPAFSFHIAGASGSAIDPATGIAHSLAQRTVSFRLEGNIIRRTGADQAPIEAHTRSAEAKKSRLGHTRR